MGFIKHNVEQFQVPLDVISVAFVDQGELLLGRAHGENKAPGPEAKQIYMRARRPLEQLLKGPTIFRERIDGML